MKYYSITKVSYVSHKSADDSGFKSYDYLQCGVTYSPHYDPYVSPQVWADIPLKDVVTILSTIT